MLGNILLGLTNVATPLNLIMLLGGVLIGLVVGATPGLTGVMAVAILVPLTYGIDPTMAFVLFTAVYAVSVYSGSITAVLFRTPGTSESAATVLDGYEMTKKGKPHEALGHAMFSSFLGGTIGAILLLFIAPQLARVALEFGSPEVFALILFTMVAVASIGVGNQTKGILCAIFGLFLATIGLDIITGVPRYTFGVPILYAGLQFIPVILGLFAVSEALRTIQGSVTAGRVIEKTKSTLPGIKTIKKLLPTYLQSIPIGVGIGALPGVGATTASFVSYAQAVRWSKHPERFGTGIPEGIAAPESANNAAAMTAMVPLLSLGIPGSATTAVMLGAFLMFGLRPGPLLFSQQPVFVYTIMIAAIIANLLIIAVSPLFIRGFSRILQVPTGVLATIILILCVVGSFAIRNNLVDVWMVFLFGFVGYALDKYKYPTAPIAIGLILGQLGEQEFRRSLVLSGGTPMIFVTNPISAVFLGLSILMLLAPVFRILRRRLSTSKVK